MAGGEREEAPALGCRFYKTKAGNEPVRDWLKSLPADVRKEIGEKKTQRTKVDDLLTARRRQKGAE